MKHRTHLTTFLALAFAAPYALSQELHFYYDGLEFVTDVRFGLDYDGDGLRDLIVASDQEDAVHLVSGVHGTLIQAFSSNQFRRALTPYEDINGDGVEEFAFVSDSLLVIASGTTFNVLASEGGANPGSNLLVCGDVDGDGYSDIAITRAQESSGAGRIKMVSGRHLATGSGPAEVWVFDGLAPGDNLGTGAAIVGDVDGDGVPDLAVSAPFETGQVGLFTYVGRLRLLSGATGTVIWTRNNIPTTNSGQIVQYGRSVAGVGDINGDGVGDVALGSPQDDTPGLDSGRIDVISGASGGIVTIISGLSSGEGLGINVAPAGDQDGDGVPDVLATLEVPAQVRVYSGATDAILSVHGGGNGFGEFRKLDGGVDATGDGIDDFTVGQTVAGGFAWLFRGECAFGGVTTYCPATMNSSGAPGRIHVDGSRSILVNDMELRANNCPWNQPGVFFYGDQMVQLPFGDGWRCVGGSTFRVNPPVITSPNGVAVRPVDFGAAPFDAGPGQITAGSMWHFQFWVRDPNAPAGNGFNLTDAASVVFCP